jgi:hypothetical protein
MLSIAYHFHVLPRYRDEFLHAWHAARDSLQQALGLVSYELNLPRGRRDAFTLKFSWDSRTSFDRFTHTWVGVWMLNGMGLQHTSFAAPIHTDIAGEAPRVVARKRAA